ncbi:TIM44-related membrane protein TimA [Phenylobacterium sp.]|uniref:TIM44-related membrane protein TimA n=1 Tax=Phenylobacterium sp. TaxID=1871053 RepID=UPI002F41015A
MQVLELIIFAGLAAIVLYQLYAVLGRRVGRQPEDPTAVPAAATPVERSAEAAAAGGADEGVRLTGLAAVKAGDPSFDVGKFLGGAKVAYETIVKAFAAGDRAQLRTLLAPPVMAGFDTAIAQREAENRTETIEFSRPPRADLETAEVVGADIARLTVRFLAEFRSRTKGPEGEGVDDRRTAELWTFERRLKSRDPNWTLIHVDAAEA